MDFSTLKQEQNNQFKVGDIFTFHYHDHFILVGMIKQTHCNIYTYSFELLKYQNLKSGALSDRIINEKSGELHMENLNHQQEIYHGDCMDQIKLELL